MNLKFDDLYVTATDVIIRYYMKTIPLKNNGFQHNSFNKSSTHKKFLHIVLFTISNGNLFIHRNAFLDTGFVATLLKREIGTKLGLKGSIKHLTITNVFLKTINALLKASEFDFKLVSFEISSASHPDKIKTINARVVSDLDINYQNFDIENFTLSKKHLKGINILSLNPCAVSLIICFFRTEKIHLHFRSGEPH